MSDKKKQKRVGGEKGDSSRSNKCTVAALLSQMNREQPKVLNESTSSSSSSYLALSGTSVATQSPTSLTSQQPASTSPLSLFDENTYSHMRKKKLSMSILASRKSNPNKLRDYFDEDSVNGGAWDSAEDPRLHNLIDNERKLKAKLGSSKASAATSDLKKKRRDSHIEREVSVATKRFKSATAAAAAAAAANEADLLNVDYSSQSQLVFEITCEDGLRVISYDINRMFLLFLLSNK